MVYYVEKESRWMSLLLLTLSVLSFLTGIICVVSNCSLMLEWDILSWVGVGMVFNFYCDWMSLVFFGFISLISGSVLFYSESYMAGDKGFRLFMVLVLMFIVSMFFLVFSLNLVSMMLGWDGLGVVSYILVVYYKNEKSSSAGMITSLSNRLGDCALLLSIACFLEMGSWNYMCMSGIKDSVVWMLVGLAAITKSAQIPFSAWLPAAMAAPTPVSALVHSSTLVTAGVYMLIRFSELMMNSSILMVFVYLGMVTTLMSSLTAMFEVDFKKVVALSTLSQLGVMVTTLSMGFVNLAFIHLLMHAIFKALLFMCSGKVIHMVGGNQDIRKMGGLMFNIPITGVVMSLSSFALCGVPFLSGFYSKDLIIEHMEMSDNFLINYISFMLVVGLSSSYSLRLIYWGLVWGVNQSVVSSSEEKDWVMLSSKIGLMTLSLVGGASLIWLVVPTPMMISLSSGLKWLAFFSMMLGFFLGLVVCSWNIKKEGMMSFFFNMDSLMVMWNLPNLSGMALGGAGSKVSEVAKSLDLGWLERLSGRGIGLVMENKSGVLGVLLTSGVKNFLVVFLVVLVIFVVDLVWSF
uniref:NADH-ubiquinone oxidoreductase chain 5 n=1 Tax=Porcellionides pruinosus TaxID=96870 RepID=A0A1P8DKI2_PORPN|nr:NADH dehydrogenase subunit 5 [Porcellionides pruinosus]